MVAVAITCLVLGGTVEAIRLGRLAQSHRERVAFHAATERGFRVMADQFGDDAAVPLSVESNTQVVPIRDLIDEQIRMRHKYERAARYPWLPVPPDPPEPE